MLPRLLPPSESPCGAGGGVGSVQRERADSGVQITSAAAQWLPPSGTGSLHLGNQQVGILIREKNILIYQVSFRSGLKGRDGLSEAVPGYPNQYASAPDACLLSPQLEGNGIV